MYSWDDLLPLLTNPYFIALIAISVLIEPFIRFLRRFYPESMKRAVTQSQKVREEMKKEDGALLQKAYLKIVFAVSALPIAIFLLNLLYLLSTVGELRLSCIHDLIAKYSAVIILFFGLYIVNEDKIERRLFKSDYQKITELKQRLKGNDPFEEFFCKNAKITGYIMLLFGATGFIVISFS